MATRSTIRTSVRTELQESAEGFWLNSELNAWLDEAYSDLISSMRVEATAALALTPSVEYVTLPTDFFLARRVEIQTTAGSSTNWTVAQPISLDLRRPSDPVNPSLTGVPTGWYIFGNKIYFVPVPDAAYSATLYYFKNATPFSGDSDSPVYPEGVTATRFDKALVLYTCAQALRKRQDAAYTTYAGDYNSAASALVRDSAQRGSSQPLVVSDDWVNE